MTDDLDNVDNAWAVLEGLDRPTQSGVQSRVQAQRMRVGDEPHHAGELGLMVRAKLQDFMPGRDPEFIARVADAALTIYKIKTRLRAEGDLSTGGSPSNPAPASAMRLNAEFGDTLPPTLSA